MTRSIRTATAQLTNAREAVTVAREIACYISITFPAVTMQVQAEQLEDKLNVHFQMEAVNREALENLQQRGTADTFLQVLAGQFERLFVNGRLQDIWC